MTTVGVTGHQDIPQGMRGSLVHEVTDALVKLGGESLIGVSSLAAGADQLFAEIILAMGGRLQVVVPSKGYDATFERSADRDRFTMLLGRAAFVETLDYPAPSEDAFLAAGRRIVDLSEVLVAIWNGLPAKGRGGTGDIVSYATERGTKVVRLWPGEGGGW